MGQKGGVSEGERVRLTGVRRGGGVRERERTGAFK